MKDMDNYSRQDSHYGTGPTEPPKNHNGLLAFLLIMVIISVGISSALSLMNISFTIQPDGQAQHSPVSFSQQEEQSSGEEPADTLPANATTELSLQQTPKSLENLPQAGGLSLQEIYTRSIDSVVSITCITETGSSSGTGVVLYSDGYIVTNCHVIDGAKTIWVRLSDGQELTARVVGKDAISDLAVLRVEANALQAAQFGDSDMVRVGDTVVAIGDPLGAQLSGTMTDGIVSAINRDIVTQGRKMTLIQTNAALNSGNSGGPLINCYGQVIGITTMKIGDTVSVAGVEGLGFAIPSLTVKEVVDQLMAQGYVSGRPTLDMTGEEVSGLYRRYYGWPDGVCVTDLTDGGAAETAGIQPGDIIVFMDNTRITGIDALNAALYAHEAGDQVAVTVYRNGGYNTVLVRIGGMK